MSHTIQMYK